MECDRQQRALALKYIVGMTALGLELPIDEDPLTKIGIHMKSNFRGLVDSLAAMIKVGLIDFFAHLDPETRDQLVEYIAYKLRNG